MHHNKIDRRMAEMGPHSVIRRCLFKVRITPESGRPSAILLCRIRATTGREQMQQHAVRGRSSYPRRRDVRLLRQSLLRSPSAETTIWFHSALSFV